MAVAKKQRRTTQKKQGIAKKSVQLGDVFEIPIASGYAYIQYVFNDAVLFRGNNHYGTLVRLLAFQSPTSVETVDVIDLEKELYCCFFPCEAACRQGWVRFVG